VKRFLKLAIGALVYLCWRVVAPRRLQSVREQYFASHSMSFLERQLLAFNLLISGMDTRSASDCWAGSAGNRFHEHRDHRLTLELVAADTFYRRPMLDEFVRHASERLRPGAAIIEVGCGAGGNLLYLRQHLAGRGFHFTGFDINHDVVASNQQYGAADVSFEVRDCFANELSVVGDLGIIFCAVLMYAREADIARLLGSVARNNHGRILIGVSEPVHDPDALDARAHNNMALTHGYRRILRAQGFSLLSESVRQEPGKESSIYHAVFEFPR
jgi:SAM-dependent methyltransferase